VWPNLVVIDGIKYKHYVKRTFFWVPTYLLLDKIIEATLDKLIGSLYPYGMKVLDSKVVPFLSRNYINGNNPLTTDDDRFNLFKDFNASMVRFSIIILYILL